ncbi:MAG: YitT family protein [Firmicutes bacterium]|nr:YitT family protein [Bacillota bacterium]
MKEKIERQTLKKIKQYLFLTLGVFIMAFAFYFFVIPSEIVIGGTTGLAMVVNRYLPNLPISIIALFFNVLFLISALILIGKREFVRSIYGSLLFPAFLALFELTIPVPQFGGNDLLMISLYSGGLIGIGFAIVIHNGGTTGGTDIGVQIVQKYTRLTIASAIYVVEASIIILGAVTSPSGISSGFIAALYAIVIVFISGKVSDSFLLGVESKKALNIVTSVPKELKAAIFSSFNRGMTEIPSQGAYTEHPKTILIMVIHNSEYHFVKKIIHDVDPKAFVYVTPATEVQGEWSAKDEVYFYNAKGQRVKKTP